MNYLEVARTIGVQGTDEQIFVLCDYVRNAAMAEGKALTTRQIKELFNKKIDRLDSLYGQYSTDRHNIQRLSKELAELKNELPYEDDEQ